MKDAPEQKPEAFDPANDGERAARLLAFGLRETASASSGSEQHAALIESLTDYAWMDTIAAGGMGVVYRARHRPSGRIVAIKVIAPFLADRDSFDERFEQEALSLAYLDHPGIVKILDFGRVGGFYYLVMPYVPGGNLRTQLPRPVDERLLARSMYQVADALHYAHEEGVVHRDVKPENLLVDPSGVVQIADFGLAKLRDAPGPTGSHSIFGTPSYMAPEQILTPKDVDRRVDIFALGVTIYEMLTSRLPMGRFALPSEIAKVDPVWDEIVGRCLEYDRERRYPDMRALQERLADPAGLRPLPMLAEPPRSRWRTAAVASGGGVVGAVLAVAALALRPPEVADAPGPLEPASSEPTRVDGPSLGDAMAAVEPGAHLIVGFDRPFLEHGIGIVAIPALAGDGCLGDLFGTIDWAIVAVHDLEPLRIDAAIAGLDRDRLRDCFDDRSSASALGSGLQHKLGSWRITEAWRPDGLVFLSTRPDLEAEELDSRLAARADSPIPPFVPGPGSLWFRGGPSLGAAGTEPAAIEGEVFPGDDGLFLEAVLEYESVDAAVLARATVASRLEKLWRRWDSEIAKVEVIREESAVRLEAGFTERLVTTHLADIMQTWMDVSDASAVTGIAACDHYIRLYLRCVETKMPEAVRSSTRDAIEKSIDAWRDAARDGDTAALAATCRMATETAEKATAAMGCRW